VKEVDHTEVMDRAQRVMAHATDVMARLDQKGGAAQQAARRDRQRLNAGLGRTAGRAAIAFVALWAIVLVLGLVKPIGMLGFVIALLATAVLAAVFLVRGGRQAVSPPAPSPDLPNGALVDRFDSYIVRVRRVLPAPAQAQLDSISAVLPSLKQSLERVETLDPQAQDARRLMSIHLPGLIDRYANVPPAYRGERDGEGKTVDERLVESLAAARAALSEVSEQLARTDLAAFETQGRFIKSRYGEQGIESEDASST
jgi:hypothetical protein